MCLCIALKYRASLNGHSFRSIWTIRTLVTARQIYYFLAPITIFSRRRSDDIELSGSSGSDESDASDAVETIQSAMRGYMARQMAMKDLNR